MKQFQQPLTTQVITTKYVMEGNSPIVYIAHHEEEGYWVFTGEQEFLPEDAIIVTLGKMIEHDVSILGVADMPVGCYAVRKNKNSPWRVVTPE